MADRYCLIGKPLENCCNTHLMCWLTFPFDIHLLLEYNNGPACDGAQLQWRRGAGTARGEDRAWELHEARSGHGHCTRREQALHEARSRRGHCTRRGAGTARGKEQERALHEARSRRGHCMRRDHCEHWPRPSCSGARSLHEKCCEQHKTLFKHAYNSH